MSDPLADHDFCAKGVAVLEDHLGPVEALLFLALISRRPFDYQRWREGHFGGMPLAKSFAKAHQAPSPSR